MGILNIDEHVEEHRLMAIRYPDKAVIPGQSVIAQSNIPFLIMPGDGGANGCSFSGTAGAFTLSAAILANIYVALTGCYAYFSGNFGGSTLPAGWYWTEFSSDTAGIVYADTYTSGTPRRPATKTPISVNLTGRITATTNEVTGPAGFSVAGTALGINGCVDSWMRYAGSTGGNKSFRTRADAPSQASAVLVAIGAAASPISESLNKCQNASSNSEKILGRTLTTGATGVGNAGSSFVTSNIVSFDTSVPWGLSVTLQGSTNTAAPVLLTYTATATYGE